MMEKLETELINALSGVLSADVCIDIDRLVKSIICVFEEEGWGYCADCPPENKGCDTCDERRGEPMRDESRD